jgi:hypothetical protein
MTKPGECVDTVQFFTSFTAGYGRVRATVSLLKLSVKRIAGAYWASTHGLSHTTTKSNVGCGRDWVCSIRGHGGVFVESYLPWVDK